MKIFKTSILFILVLFVIVHTLFTLLHVLPENVASASLKEESKKYMAPLFDQGWALFAPVPEVNKRVYVSYLNSRGQWSGWEAPFEKYFQAHQSTRVSAYGKIVLSVSSTLHYLYNENEGKLKSEKNILGNSSSGYFRVLKYAVERDLENSGISSKKTKLLIVYSVANCAEKQMYSIYYPEN